MSVTSQVTRKVYPKTERKPLLFIEDGQVKFRTKLVRNKDLAIHFARCISKNRRFAGPEVRVRREGYIVTYLPSNPERQRDLITRLQAERTLRASQEEAGYFWNDQRGFSFCLSGSGQEYRVSEKFCTCRDFADTCAELGLRCKHQIAMSNRKEKVS